jgi:formylglycine-generating enzyme required for sulfatase activity
MKIIMRTALALFSVAAALPQNNSGLTLITGGTFLMGSPASEAWREKDETTHSVILGDFYLGTFEVTQKEYRDLIGNNPSTFSGDTLPVDSVTWFDAVTYCNARSHKEGLQAAYTITGTAVTWNRAANGYRLPTEAEWEYACRAGTVTPFNTENSIATGQANYYGTYPYGIENHYWNQQDLETKPGEYRQHTLPVSSFEANKWGLYNMHGNVWEWCWDWYGPYSIPATAQTDPTGAPSGTYRVNRGGGWNDFAKHLRSAYRASTPPENRSFNLGFRLARNAH